MIRKYNNFVIGGQSLSVFCQALYIYPKNIINF